MKSNKDFIGEQFNDWTVIDWIKGKKDIEWICKCKCGNIKQQKVDNIKNGRSKMCKECAGKLKRKEKKPKEERILKIRFNNNLDWTEENTFIGTYKEYLKEKRKRKELREKKDKENKIIQKKKEWEEYCNETIGKKYNRLTVKEIKKKNGEIFWECECECGNKYGYYAKYIKKGYVKSCGCISREIIENSISNKRIYKVWSSMIERCYNPNKKNYKNYGGRGIKVCDEWKNSSRAFIEWAYKNGYDENAKKYDCTIDRINNDGNYEPSNCRWVDMKIQANNRRPYKREGRTYNVNGKDLTLQEIYKIYNISPQLFNYRKSKGMTNEEAIFLEKRVGYKYSNRKNKNHKKKTPPL